MSYVIATKDSMEEKQRVDSTKIYSLNTKIEELNNELNLAKMDRDSKESEKLQLLMAENKKLQQDFKGSLALRRIRIKCEIIRFLFFLKR